MADTLAAIQDQTFASATAATAASYPNERRLSEHQLATYLDRREFAVVGTTRPDGRAHAAISAYVRRDTTLWLPCVETSIRARNLHVHPWTTMVVTEGDHARHVLVIIEGPAEVVPRGDVPKEVRTAVADWATVWIRLRATRILSYGAEGYLREPST
jgi:hypothetical protein